MSGDPCHDGVEIMKRLGFGRGRPAHDDDLNPERARRLDFGIGRAPAAVLGDQRFDPLVAHKRGFVSERERPARKDQLAARQRVDLSGPVDRPDEVAMLRRSREGRELQPALRKEDSFWNGSESVDGVIHGLNLDPAIARLACPWRAGEDNQRRPSRPTGRNRIGRHMRSERMRRVDDPADALGLEIGGQTLDAAEASDALGNRRPNRIGRRPRQRQDWLNTGVLSEPPRERVGLRRPAENEQTKAVQWAAP